MMHKEYRENHLFSASFRDTLAIAMQYLVPQASSNAILKRIVNPVSFSSDSKKLIDSI